MNASVDRWLRVIRAEEHLQVALRAANELDGTERVITPISRRELFGIFVDDEGAEELHRLAVADATGDAPA